jgi:ABC-type nitrate/sulfonate/bicarbonate transport system permease component
VTTALVDPSAVRSSPIAGIGDALLRTGRVVLTAAVSVAVIIGLWIAFLKVFHVNSLVGKSPGQVWQYLFGDDAAAHRKNLMHGLRQTLYDAGVGYVVGLGAAAIVALAFVLFRPLEQALLPVAIVVRSIPLVAMTPLIIFVFGRGVMGTAVIAGLIVFFPSLVTICFGLRSASRQATELCQVYGAGRLTVARKVMLPSSLPAFFASARISVPGAIVGAMIAEWLSTGRGLGYAMATDPNSFDYAHLWASVAVLTATSVLIYFALAAVEALALARIGAPTD